MTNTPPMEFQSTLEMVKMLNKLCLTFACGLLLASATAGPLNITVPCGTLRGLERLETPVAFVDEDEALKAGLTKPTPNVPDNLRVEREPDEGRVYVVLSFTVQVERTLSPCDYVLMADGEECPCLGASVGKSLCVDFRNLQIPGPTEAKLVFACSANAYGASLKTAFNGLPIPTIQNLELQERPEPPAAAEQVGEAKVDAPKEADDQEETEGEDPEI